MLKYTEISYFRVLPDAPRLLGLHNSLPYRHDERKSGDGRRSFDSRRSASGSCRRRSSSDELDDDSAKYKRGSVTTECVHSEEIAKEKSKTDRKRNNTKTELARDEQKSAKKLKRLGEKNGKLLDCSSSEDDESHITVQRTSLKKKTVRNYRLHTRNKVHDDKASGNSKNKRLHRSADKRVVGVGESTRR
jgi:hypothetical protein